MVSPGDPRCDGWRQRPGARCGDGACCAPAGQSRSAAPGRSAGASGCIATGSRPFRLEHRSTAARWAAGRPVSAEVWRCVAPHDEGEGVAALTHGWNAGNERERLAIALALRGAPHTPRGLPADEITNYQARLASQNINWHDLA